MEMYVAITKGFSKNNRRRLSLKLSIARNSLYRSYFQPFQVYICMYLRENGVHVETLCPCRFIYLLFSNFFGSFRRLELDWTEWNGNLCRKELGNDKLIYDSRSGRFYEKKIEEVCREEYCAIDETTGERQPLARPSARPSVRARHLVLKNIIGSEIWKFGKF